MDQIKIGNFIAECRKSLKLTQAQLAEKLGITDRAVSKWETGKTMPDSSIMLDLCRILKISVNDLLSGEMVTMENYNKELENKLIEMVKQKEANDKRLLSLEWVLAALSLVILFVPIIIAVLCPLEEWQRIVIAFAGFLPALVGFFFALKIEQVAGYYRCACCGNRYRPSYAAVTFSMHMGRTRYLRCPKCSKRSWHHKVIEEEEGQDEK